MLNIWSKRIRYIFRKPVLWICIFTSFIYSNSLNNAFLNWDDNAYIVENKFIQNFDLNAIFNPFSGIDTNNYYHPLGLFTLAVDFLIWKLNPFGFHLTNFLLFLLTILVMYLTLKKLLNNEVVSLLTVLLFAVHPIHVEAVAWICSRPILLTTLFCFLSFYFFLFSLSSEKKCFYYTLSLISFILGLLSHLIILPFPLLLILYLFCFSSPLRSKSFLKKTIFIAPFFMVILFFGFFLKHGNKTVSLSISFYSKVLTGVSIFFNYMKLLFWPVNLTPIYSMKIETTLRDYSLIIPFCVFLFFIILSFYFLFKDRKIFFALGYFVIFYVPVSNVFVMLDFSMADRYVFSSSFGICLAIVLLFYKLLLFGHEKNRKSLVFYCYLTYFVFIVLLSAVTYGQCMVWKNSFTLWSSTIKNNPYNYMPYLGLALEYDKIGLNEEAVGEYKKVIELEPACLKAHINLAANYYILRDYDLCIYEVKKSLEIDPSLSVAKELLRKSYEMKFRKMISSKYDFDIISLNVKKYVDTGKSYRNEKKLNKAINEFSSAISLNPFCEEAYYNLALTYIDKKDYNKAKEIFLNFIKLFPDRKKEIHQIIDTLPES